MLRKKQRNKMWKSIEAAKNTLTENHKLDIIRAHFYLETFPISLLFLVRYSALLIYHYFIRWRFFGSLRLRRLADCRCVLFFIIAIINIFVVILFILWRKGCSGDLLTDFVTVWRFSWESGKLRHVYAFSLANTIDWFSVVFGFMKQEKHFVSS